MPLNNSTLDKGEVVTISLMDRSSASRVTVERCDALGLTFVQKLGNEYECVFVPWHRVDRVVLHDVTFTGGDR